MRRSTSTVRRACAVGTTIALVGLTTGLGIMTATAASAAPADQVSSSQVATSGDQAASSSQGTGTQDPDGGQATAGTDATTGSGDDTAAGTAPDGSTETGTDTSGAMPDTDGTGTGTGATPGSTGSTAPASGSPTVGTTPTDAPTEAQQDAPAVTIVGDARTGNTLEAKPTGFDEDGSFRFVWTIDGEPGAATLAKVDSLTLDEALAGKRVTVTVTGTPTDGSAARTTSATSETITQAPVFVDESGEPIVEGADVDDPQYLDATAGERFSYTFHADGFPAPSYRLDWYWDDEDGDDTVVSTEGQQRAQEHATANAQRNAFGAVGSGWQADEGDDEESGPEVQLPEGFTFDPATGVLSGSTDLAFSYDFAVTATSGTVSTTQYVELTVARASPPVSWSPRATQRPSRPSGPSCGSSAPGATSRRSRSTSTRTISGRRSTSRTAAVRRCSRTARSSSPDSRSTGSATTSRTSTRTATRSSSRRSRPTSRPTSSSAWTTRTVAVPPSPSRMPRCTP